MPVPRRFDRRPPDRDDTRINERIRVREVRLIGEDGEQVGVLEIAKALEYARSRDLDLVEVAADARPPVCRVLDYSKYKYEQEQKAKAARKHQKQVNVREIKLRPKIADNDYETKKNHVVRFLSEECGMPGERLVAAGLSHFRPVGDNATAAGRRRNRRIELTLLPMPE